MQSPSSAQDQAYFLESLVKEQLRYPRMDGSTSLSHHVSGSVSPMPSLSPTPTTRARPAAFAGSGSSKELAALEISEGDLPLRRSLFAPQADEGQRFARFGGDDGDDTRTSAWACEVTPSALDLSTEGPDTSRHSEYDLHAPPTPIAAVGAAVAALTAEFEKLSPNRHRYESSTSCNFASIMQFGCIGAEAVEHLERVADAECWYTLNKQLNSMGNRTANSLEEWERRATQPFNGLIEAKGLEEYRETTDGDVWATLHRQIGALDKEVTGIAERHQDGAHNLEIEGARRLEEQIENNDLQGKIARLEVDVQELMGDGCDVKERKRGLQEQIRTLQGHVSNVVDIADNYISMTPISWEAKEFAPCEALQRVKDMMQQVCERARMPLLEERLLRAEQMEVDPLSSAQIRALLDPVDLDSRLGSVRFGSASSGSQVGSAAMSLGRPAAGYLNAGLNGPRIVVLGGDSLSSPQKLFVTGSHVHSAADTPAAVLRAAVTAANADIRVPWAAMQAGGTIIGSAGAGATPKAVRASSPLSANRGAVSPLPPATRCISPVRVMGAARAVSPRTPAARRHSPLRTVVSVVSSPSARGASPVRAQVHNSPSSVTSTARPLPMAAGSWASSNAVTSPTTPLGSARAASPVRASPSSIGQRNLSSFRPGLCLGVTLSHVPVPGSAQVTRDAPNFLL